MSSGPTRIHIVNPMNGEVGGSEWRCYELARDLRAFGEVVIWSEGEAVPVWRERARPRQPRLWRGDFPRGGVLVVVGAYFELGPWLRFARPRRVVLVYNTPQPERFHEQLRRLSRHAREVECAFASRWLAESVAIPGPVLLSPVDLERFHPAPQRAAGERFRVGRLSRDVERKHHAEDPELYRRLAAEGFAVDVMGGTVLSSALEPTPAVVLRPCAPDGAGDFLRSLDCFFYRTATGYREPHGRVVSEAMACGLPVVCDRRGGWVDIVEHGVNGFLFDREDEALAILRRLRADPQLRQSIGRAARSTAERQFAPARRRETARWLVQG